MAIRISNLNLYLAFSPLRRPGINDRPDIKPLNNVGSFLAGLGIQPKPRLPINLTLPPGIGVIMLTETRFRLTADSLLGLVELLTLLTKSNNYRLVEDHDKVIAIPLKPLAHDELEIMSLNSNHDNTAALITQTNPGREQ